MDTKQIKGLLNTLQAAYPNQVKHLSDEECKAQVVLWRMMFAKDDASLVGQVIRQHIATSNYYPSIAEIRAGIRQRTMRDPEKLFERFKEIGYKATHPEVIEQGQGRDITYYTKHYDDEDLLKEPLELAEYVQSVRRLKGLYNEYKENSIKAKTSFMLAITKIQERMDVEALEYNAQRMLEG